jgi:hypothetical protein
MRKSKYAVCLSVSRDRMAVVFGGKLLAPKQKRPVGLEPANLASTKDIQSLSKREQELLAELQQTRTNIVKELVRISPEVKIDEVDSWKNTLKKYKSNLKIPEKGARRLHTTSLGRRSQFSEISSTHSFQSLPIMSSTGEFAFSFKAKREEPIVLPVLTLPAVRPPSQTIRAGSSFCHSTPHPPKFNSDPSILLLDIEQSDVEFMLEYFSITKSQWGEVSTNFDKLCKYSSSDRTEDNLLLTVFASTDTRMRDFLPTHHSKSLSQSFGSSGNSLPPLRPSTRQPTPQSLFRGSGAHQFSATDLVASNPLKLTRSMSWKKTGTVPSTTRKRIQSFRPELSSSDHLRQELMQSLGSMQQYTAEVCSCIFFVLTLALSGEAKYLECSRFSRLE